MLFAASAASSAIDLLSSLIPGPSTSSKTGIVPASASSFSVTDSSTSLSPATGFTGGASSGALLSSGTFNSLLQAQSQSQSASTQASAALQDLFSQIDGNGDGKISKSEFEAALGAGGTNLQMADDVFTKMDRNGDGNTSLDEMSSALKGAGHRHRHHPAGGTSQTDPLMQALQGASSTSTANSDGSTTTKLTYADGTTITMTQPAATSSASSNATNSYNFTERLIQRQAQALAASAQQSVSMSV